MKIKFGKATRINIPMREYDPLRAFEIAEKMNLPKHREMGYEIVRYKGKFSFETIPVVYIKK